MVFKQGAQAHCGYLCQRSYSTMGEAQPDQLCVPAIRILKLLTSCSTALLTSTPTQFRQLSDPCPLRFRPISTSANYDNLVYNFSPMIGVCRTIFQ